MVAIGLWTVLCLGPHPVSVHAGTSDKAALLVRLAQTCANTSECGRPSAFSRHIPSLVRLPSCMTTAFPAALSAPPVARPLGSTPQLPRSSMRREEKRCYPVEPALSVPMHDTLRS